MKDELIQYLTNQGFKLQEHPYESMEIYLLSPFCVSFIRETRLHILDEKRPLLKNELNELEGTVYNANLLDLTTFRSLLKANGFVEWTFEGWLEKQGWIKEDSYNCADLWSNQGIPYTPSYWDSKERVQKPFQVGTKIVFQIATDRPLISWLYDHRRPHQTWDYAKCHIELINKPIPQSEAAAIQLFQDYGIEVKEVEG